MTRGLDPDVPLKPSGVAWLGDIPAHWEVRRLKALFREVDERSVTGDQEQLSVSHLSGVTPRSQKNVTMFEAESYEGHKLCHSDDVVVNTMWAWMGALGVAKQSGLVSPAYAVYRNRNCGDTVTDYIGNLLRTQTYVDEYNRRSTGIHSSRLRLYPDQFLNIPIALPPIVEQRSMIRGVELVERQATQAQLKHEREIELIQEYRARIISDVVTGKRDVRSSDISPFCDVARREVQATTRNEVG